MENETIETQPAFVPTTETEAEQVKKLLDELNESLKDKEGQWIYVDGVGPCYSPYPLDPMGKPLGVPPNTTPPSIIESIAKWGGSIDFDNIPQNAVVLIKLNVDNPMRVQMMQQVIARQVLQPRIEKLKEKKVCILFMQAEDDISVMTEEEMNQAGWEKKEKSRIITLS